MEGSVIRLKLTFSGDVSVGKSSLIDREVTGCFNAARLASIGLDFKVRDYPIGSNTIRVAFWNLDGEATERRRHYRRPYFTNSQAVCLCFSLDDPNSFQHLPRWLSELRELTHCRVWLVGCKNDREQTVPRQLILAFAEKEGLPYFTCSAKTGCGMENFRVLVEEVSVQMANHTGKTESVRLCEGRESAWCYGFCSG